MCGIVAVVPKSPANSPLQFAHLDGMLEALHHRGPDGTGVYADRLVALAMTRLAIVGGENGRQPVWNEQRSVALVCNGEIYNHSRLRSRLEALGHVFQTDSDVETIVHLYEELGYECVTELDGIFAFALWDACRRALFVARDPLGVKPLYVADTGSRFLFASEIRALLTQPDVRPALDPQGFVDYHTFRFVPGPHTMIRGVEKLKAAECGVVTAGALQRWKYWSPWKVRPTAHVRASAGARAGRLRNDLFDAVCCQAATQVPSGILLSGGLDSTALLAIHRHIFGHAPDTYTISFTPPRGQAKRSEYDEADYAEEVAGWYQSRHTHEQVSARQVLDMLPRIVADLDEPVADPTAIPLWFACRMAHEAGVKVLFSGEGLDELFGGYGVYQQVRWLRALQMLPVTLRQSLSNFLARFELPGSGVMRRSTRPVWDWYQGVGGLFSSHERKALFLQPVQKWLGSYDPDCHMHRCLLQSNAIRTPDVLTQMMVFDFCTWLPENTLIKSDKVSMAHSIELRVPFLDRRVVEYAWSLPVDDKVHGRTGKWIVRRALSGIVPPFVLRRQKAGFPVPLTAWMFGEWKEFAWDTLLNPRSVTRQYYRGDAIARLFNIEPAQRRRAARLLWAMITLELWIQHLQMTSATGFDLPSCALSK